MGAVVAEVEKKIAEEKIQLQEVLQGEMCSESEEKEPVEAGKTELQKAS